MFNVLVVYSALTFTAMVLGLFRSDAGKIFNDLKHFIRLNNIIVSFGVIILLYTLAPFSIPYTIKNIFNKVTNKHE